MDKIQNFMPATSSGQKITFKIVFSYFFDYAVIAVLAILYAVLDKVLTPNAQPFSTANWSLQYPMADPERVPIWQAMVYSCLGPAIVIAIYTMLFDGLFSKSKQGISRGQRYTWGDRLWELNCGILGLFLAQGSAFVITGSLKNLIGKPRPDILARCILPDNIANNSAIFQHQLVYRANCTQTDSYIMQDGFRSFPSGHSSSSFAGLGYLSLYLAAKLHVLDQRGEVWRTFLVLIPTLGASVIAGSRIIDARHHPFDVIFGSILGVLCAWASYRQYFPPISHTWEKGRAYPIRTWGIPLRRPEGTIGTDGQLYGYRSDKSARFDRTRNAMMPEDDSEDRQAMLGTSMEPLRAANQGYTTGQMAPPPFQQFQQRNSSLGAMSRQGSGDDEDTDYEHVRVKAGNITTGGIPATGLTRSQGGSPITTSPGGTNAFREQLDRNQSMRGGADEQDLAFQRPVR